MDDIQFERVGSGDVRTIEKIAGWYFDEWTIEAAKTIAKLSAFPAEGFPFQILMSVNNIPIATGGLYEHVGLLAVAPRFKVYGPWLALVLTTPENRKKGYGTLLCEEIQNRAKDLGLKEMFLFTRTAESLYRRMGWALIEQNNMKGQDVFVMKRVL